MPEFSVFSVAQDIISKTTLEGRNLMALILVIQAEEHLLAFRGEHRDTGGRVEWALVVHKILELQVDGFITFAMQGHLALGGKAKSNGGHCHSPVFEASFAGAKACLNG
jgi:hypothetical protein